MTYLLLNMINFFNKTRFLRGIPEQQSLMWELLELERVFCEYIGEEKG